jgi:hypothetical protein
MFRLLFEQLGEIGKRLKFAVASDLAPALAEKKYLKTIYHCHVCKGTLHAEVPKITVRELDL